MMALHQMPIITLTIDFGLLPMHSIGNLAWIDSNNNGLVDAGEMGIPGVSGTAYSDPKWM
ncbi:MAG: hypothetical protein IPF93_22195 [Saprospiraceae bacterium]|nr:hypothetical protein [Saprospiraceae bacterium]